MRCQLVARYENSLEPLPVGAGCKTYSAAAWQVLCRSRLLLDDLMDPICKRCQQHHAVTGHSADCLKFHQIQRHNDCLDAMKRGFEEEYTAVLEPSVGPPHFSYRADLKLTPKTRATTVSDLTIVDQQCASNLEIMTKALTDREAPSPDAPMHTLCCHQTNALFAAHRKRKDDHYRDKNISGIMPWIVTTYGLTDPLFDAWLDHHSLSVRNRVRSAICAKLLKSRTLRLSSKPF